VHLHKHTEYSMTDKIDLYRVLGGLYISSIKPLLNNTDLKSLYGIESIVSVQKDPIPEAYRNYRRLQVPIDDLEDENLFTYFQRVNDFIEEGLKASSDGKKGKVLVHCNAGRSRSVSFVIAFLMKKYRLSYKQARYAVQRKYPEGVMVEPNAGFSKQLQLYYNCGCSDDVRELDARYPQYRAFKTSLLKRADMNNDSSYRDVGNKDATKAPSAEQEESNTNDKPKYVFRCKKCGQVLANSVVFIPHTVPTDDDDKQKYFYKTTFWTKEVYKVEKASAECTHYFFEPLNWMKPELSKGELEGRFDCFKCGSKVGGYHWQGSRCSCGRWMVPAIHLLKAKVDQLATSKP